jgi:AsmA protein
MPRPVKLVLSVIVAFLLLLAVAAGTLFLLVDPDEYKSRIAALAGRHTGRSVAIEGDIRLSLLPVTGLVTDRIVISAPAGFDGPPLVRAARLRVDVDPFSLIQGRLRITRLQVEGLEVHLVRLEDGRVSWAGLSAEEGTGAEQGRSGGPLLSPGLTAAGVVVENGSLTWEDRVADRSCRVQGIALSLEGISPGELSDLTLSFTSQIDRPGLETETRLSARILLRPDGRGARLEGLRLNVQARGPALPGEEADLELLTALDVDWEEGSLRVDDLQGSLGGTGVHGWAHVDDLSRPALSFDLGLGVVDLDAYGLSKRRAAPGPPEPNGPEEAEVPPLLRSLEAEGRLRAERVRVAGLDVEDLDLRLTASGGRLRADPVRASLSSGILRGSAGLDASGGQAVPALLLHAEGLEVGPLVQTLAGRREMTGTAEFDVDLRASGLDPGAWPRSLNGSAAFEILDGTVRFFGLPRNAEESSPGQVNPLQETERPTPFERIDGTVQARDGRLTNRDLRFRSTVLSADGDGVVDLREQAVAYDLAVRIPVLPDVWVRVAGPLDDPGVRVQPLRMVRDSVEGLGKEALGLPGNIGRGARSLGEGVTELPGSIGDKIKGLFE